MISFELPDNTLSHTPKIHDSVFIANGAQVMGNIQLDEASSVWYNAVLRGDINKIHVGYGSNIQDGCILHMENDLPCRVGQYVTVGHMANLHACCVEDYCLVGIGAIILSGAHIGKGSVIGAGSTILENTTIPPFSLVVGTPGKVIRSTPDDIIAYHKKWAEKYINLAKKHQTHSCSSNNAS